MIYGRGKSDGSNGSDVVIILVALVLWLLCHLQSTLGTIYRVIVTEQGPNGNWAGF